MPQSLEGFSGLATLMGESPNVAIFRRFSDLNLLNLLYHQSELNWLTRNYREMPLEDLRPEDPEANKFSGQWIERAGPESRPQQWDMWLEIRSKLEQYSK